MNRVWIIYDEAIKLFSEKGYRGATLQDLAKRVGIKKASIYHYVESKEEILYNIFLIVAGRIKEEFFKIHKNFPNPLERIGKFIECYLSFIEKDKDAFSIFLAEKKELTPEHREEIERVCDLLNLMMRDAIKEAKERGFIDKSIKEDITTLFIFGACNWTVKWFSPSGKYSMKDIAKEFSRVFLHGIKNEDAF